MWQNIKKIENWYVSVFLSFITQCVFRSNSSGAFQLYYIKSLSDRHKIVHLFFFTKIIINILNTSD